MDWDYLRVTNSEYHYLFGFSNFGICISQTLESRSFLSDIKLRDYLNMKGVRLSSSTYLINGQSDKPFYACIIATHDGLPHQVSFSYEQIFKTTSIPSKDTYPYELKQ